MNIAMALLINDTVFEMPDTLSVFNILHGAPKSVVLWWLHFGEI